VADSGGYSAPVTLAALLAAVAGFLDALNFTRLTGTFIANQTGNTVLVGIAVADGKASEVWPARALVLPGEAGRSRRSLLAVEAALLVRVRADRLAGSRRPGWSRHRLAARRPGRFRRCRDGRANIGRPAPVGPAGLDHLTSRCSTTPDGSPQSSRGTRGARPVAAHCSLWLSRSWSMRQEQHSGHSPRRATRCGSSPPRPSSRSSRPPSYAAPRAGRRKPLDDPGSRRAARKPAASGMLRHGRLSGSEDNPSRRVGFERWYRRGMAGAPSPDEPLCDSWLCDASRRCRSSPVPACRSSFSR
jgi:Protein of unknown function (DUF1275)